MKLDKSIISSFVLLVLLTALYRIIPGRPYGFAPQIAIALFSGSIVKDKKFAFLLPLLSMLLSDIMYEVLHHFHLTVISGFYGWGQIINYIVYLSITLIGFSIKSNKALSIALGCAGGALYFFVVSNFICWIGGTDINNIPYTKDFEGIRKCYTDALPFFDMSIYSTLFFGAMLFGGYHLFNRSTSAQQSIA